jgi:hypothetical protein
VIVALFWGAEAAGGWVDNARVRALAAEAALQGVRLAMVTLADLDLEGGRAQYRILGPQGWSTWPGPLPDVLMMGGGPRSEADNQALAELRQRVPFATDPLPSKGMISERLLDSAVAPHILPFRHVDPQDPERSILDFLAAHPRAVLKPSVGGRRGRDVIFLARAGDDIVSRELNRQWRLPAAQAVAPLASRLARNPWLIQQYVVSRTRDGRAFDIRVHVHKDGRGDWAVVRAYVRLSEAGLLVSNTARGGYQGELENFLAGQGQRGAELAQRVRALGIETGAAVEAAFASRLDELGIDILVDRSLHPWIIEVNTGPQSRFHEFDRARFVIDHARHIAGRRRAGDWPMPPDPAPAPAGNPSLQGSST